MSEQLVFEWRLFTSCLAGATFTMNVWLVWRLARWVRSANKLGDYRRKPFFSRVGWPAAAALTNLVSIYFRVADEMRGIPFGVGDVTVLVPTLGFMTAALWSISGIAALEEATDQAMREET